MGITQTIILFHIQQVQQNKTRLLTASFSILHLAIVLQKRKLTNFLIHNINEQQFPPIPKILVLSLKWDMFFTKVHNFNLLHTYVSHKILPIPQRILNFRFEGGYESLCIGSSDKGMQRWNYTPLMTAAYLDYLDVLKFLEEYSGHPSMENALTVAMHAMSKQCACYLMTKTRLVLNIGDFVTLSNIALLEYMLQGHCNIVKWMVKHETTMSLPLLQVAVYLGITNTVIGIIIIKFILSSALKHQMVIFSIVVCMCISHNL